MTLSNVYEINRGVQWASGVTSTSFITDWQTLLTANGAGSTVALVGVVSNVLTANVTDLTGDPSSPTVVSTYSLSFGDWVVNGTYFPAAYFATTHVSNSGILASLSLQEEVGAIGLPALLLGGNTSVTITLSGTFPSTGYAVKRRAVSGVTVLSTLTFAETARTTSSITYTVTATGVATAAGFLLVDCYLLSAS